MAHELSSVGVAWMEERDVRLQVAATVAAESSDDALADKRLVDEAWVALGAAETALTRLRDTPANDRGQNFSFLLQSAEREVNARVKAVQQRQLQAEKNKKRRAELQLSRERSAAIPSPVTPSPASSCASSPFPVVASTVQATVPFQAQSTTPALPPYRAPTRRVALPPPRVSYNAAPSTAQTAAVDEYRGGNVLPSVHSVMITSADRRSAAGRYLDDGDEHLFQSRLNLSTRTRGTTVPPTQAAVAAPLLDSASQASDALDETTDFLDSLLAAEDQQTEDDQATREEPSEAARGVDEHIAPIAQLPSYLVSRNAFERLLDYQRLGVEWLAGLHERRFGGILGDEMGLGKTIQVAVLLNMLQCSSKLLGPVLVVCPLTVVAQWVKELHTWVPQLRVCVYHSSGTSNNYTSLVAEVRNTPTVIITTYMTLTLKCTELIGANFQYVILDEGHKIANPEAAVTLAAKAFVTPHRLILTGSPIQNTLKELWSLFDFAYPGLLGTLDKFVAEFETPINASRNPKATKLEVVTAVECAKMLRDYIQPFLLRRLKREVNAMLPPKYERVIRCSLTDAQLEAYVQVLQSKEVQEILGNGSLHRFLTGGLDRHGRDGTGSLWTGPKQFSGRRGMSVGMRQQAFRILHTLRHICNHVDIFHLKSDDAADGGSKGPLSLRSNLEVKLNGSSKLTTLKRLMEYWKDHGHKVLVFSQFKMMLDIIENLCEQEKHSYMRIDGGTPPRDRTILIDKYNADPSIFVALLTTKVGGLGVNLTGADRVVIFDPDWNPVNDEQARERAWRIGQTREVCVYRMISSGTIEETILHRQLAKTYITEKVLNDPTLQRSFSMHSFVDAFYLGTEYASRLPSSAQRVISTLGDFTALEADAEMERENEEVLAPIVKQEGDEESKADTRKRLAVLSGVTRTPTVTITRRPASDVKKEGASDESRKKTELQLLQSMVDGDDLAVDISGATAFSSHLAQLTAHEALERVVMSAATATVKRESSSTQPSRQPKRQRDP